SPVTQLARGPADRLPVAGSARAGEVPAVLRDLLFKQAQPAPRHQVAMRADRPVRQRHVASLIILFDESAAHDPSASPSITTFGGVSSPASRSSASSSSPSRTASRVWRAVPPTSTVGFGAGSPGSVSRSE